jgi:hypothetical protein
MPCCVFGAVFEEQGYTRLQAGVRLVTNEASATRIFRPVSVTRYKAFLTTVYDVNDYRY